MSEETQIVTNPEEETLQLEEDKPETPVESSEKDSGSVIVHKITSNEDKAEGLSEETSESQLDVTVSNSQVKVTQNTSDAEITIEEIDNSSDNTKILDSGKIVTTDGKKGKPSRELQLLLRLSKESNMDTNIMHKRQSLPAVLDAKRAMRSQNPEFVAKHQNFLAKVTKEGTSSDSEDKNDADDEKKRKSLDRNEDGVNKINKKLPPPDMVQCSKDGFCWRCHKDGIQISCETCPRSYHHRCLKNFNLNSNHWICPECSCLIKVECTNTRSLTMKELSLKHLCELLRFAHKRMVQCKDSEPFLQPVNESEFPDYKKYIIQPMDLAKLEKNINNNIYGSTNGFEADAKWILHNSIIFNSYQSKLTTVAKSILKICKQEMAEIENCPTCYLNANTIKNWFIEVCPKPHILVWAKLKGFPYWPAKVMSSNLQGLVDVRFFGEHDRAWVPAREVFLYSKKDPNSNNQKRQEINECVKEVDCHIEKLKDIYKEFCYPPYRMQYNPEQEEEQWKLFFPNYNGEIKKRSPLSVRPQSAGENAQNDSNSETEEDKEVKQHTENFRMRSRLPNTAEKFSPISKRTRSRSRGLQSSEDGRSSAPLIKRRRNSVHSNKNSPVTTKTEKKDTETPDVVDEKKPEENSDDNGKLQSKKLNITDKIMKRLSSDNDKPETNDAAPATDVKQVILGDDEIRKDESSNKENKKDPEVIQVDACDDLLEELYSEDVNVYMNGGVEKKLKRSIGTVEKNPSENQKKQIKLIDVNTLKEQPKIQEKVAEKTAQTKQVEREKSPEIQIQTVDKLNNSDGIISIDKSITIDRSNASLEDKRRYFSALNISEKVNPAAQQGAVPPKPSWINKQRARKTFPTNGNSAKHGSAVKRKDLNDTGGRKDVKTDQSNAVRADVKSDSNQTKEKEKKNETKVNGADNVVMITPAKNITILSATQNPPVLSSSLTNVTNSILSVVQPTTFANYLVPTPGLTSIITSNVSKPATSSSAVTTITSAHVPIINKAINMNVPPLCSISSKDTSERNQMNEKLIKALTCRPPPALKPKPPGPLSVGTDPTMPSTAGPITTKINSIAFKLTDYFRDMTASFLSEFGDSQQSSEAQVATLKLENERLKQLYSQDVAELKKNLQTILGDFQKILTEERQRAIEETRAVCESETMKKVDEAKSKQWCANCKKESQYYCCWNTSYCDYPCQVEHWKTHINKCTQNTSNAKNVASRPLLKKSVPAKAAGSSLLVKSPQQLSFINKTKTTPTNKPAANKSPNHPNNTITIVEQTPGNYEVLGNGPISVGGRLYNLDKSKVILAQTANKTSKGVTGDKLSS